VVFTPQQGRSARGTIQSDGSFTLSTYGKSDGAIVGMHKVSVFEAPNRSEGGAIDFNRPPPPPSVPRRYRDPDQSGLTFDVQPDVDNTANLELRAK